jgi:hypothetical protein
LLGDLEIPVQGALDQTMARSIVRDLIRSFDPQLENPGAIRRLITAT